MGAHEVLHLIHILGTTAAITYDLAELRPADRPELEHLAEKMVAIAEELRGIIDRPVVP